MTDAFHYLLFMVGDIMEWTSNHLSTHCKLLLMKSYIFAML